MIDQQSIYQYINISISIPVIQMKGVGNNLNVKIFDFEKKRKRKERATGLDLTLRSQYKSETRDQGDAHRQFPPPLLPTFNQPKKNTKIQKHKETVHQTSSKRATNSHNYSGKSPSDPRRDRSPPTTHPHSSLPHSGLQTARTSHPPWAATRPRRRLPMCIGYALDHDVVREWVMGVGLY